jgi:CBS-domain-containing membrane protein
MNTQLPISTIMTTAVLTLGPKDLMRDVEDIFRKNTIHHIPVVEENGKLAGIISQTDFYKIQHGMTLFKSKNVESFNSTLMGSLLVEEVMTKQVAALHFNEPINVAVGILQENLFHALPVVDDNHKLVGILTTHDLLNYAFRKEITN